MAVVGSQEMIEARRHHLAALVYELEARSLQWRLVGPDESVLRVANNAASRQIMVVATPTGSGWSYLWSGGGMSATGRPAEVAEKIARALG